MGICRLQFWTGKFPVCDFLCNLSMQAAKIGAKLTQLRLKGVGEDGFDRFFSGFLPGFNQGFPTLLNILFTDPPPWPTPWWSMTYSISGEASGGQWGSGGPKLVGKRAICLHPFISVVTLKRAICLSPFISVANIGGDSRNAASQG